VVVVPVDEDDVDVGLPELEGRSYPGEASSQDDDAWPRVHVPTRGHTVSISDPVAAAKALSTFSPG